MAEADPAGVQKGEGARPARMCKSKAAVARAAGQISSRRPGGSALIERRNAMFRLRVLTILLVSFLLAGCSHSSESCPPYTPVDLPEADAFARDDNLPFRFPLDEFSGDGAPFFTYFGACSDGPVSAREYHAAEDFLRPAGTPVYAMADGRVSFSGPMGGYGWLVIIDHPQANLYSLYGHLSPSRWRIESGTVGKGELIAYLGDSNENGGSSEHPLVPHLHFGVRAGQRADYPGTGEWRWQAGWIKPCPQDLGWLQPSVIIASQDIPVGGYPEPAPAFLVVWGSELLLTGIYLFGGVCMLVFAIRKDKPFFLVFPGVILIAAGWIFYSKGMVRTYTLPAIGILLLVLGIYKSVRRSTRMPPARF